MCCMMAMIALGMQAMRARLQQQEADNTKLQAIARDATKVGSCTMRQHRQCMTDTMSACRLLSF